jgi:hypothetical protein
MKTFFISSLTVAALGAVALTASVPQVANAYVEATCPTGWTRALNSPAIDGIYCDMATTSDILLEIPAGITEVLYLTVGGGGGGADGHVSDGLVYAGGGGGAGELSSGDIAVNPGDDFAIEFSSGGVATDDSNGQDGSDVSYTINGGPNVPLSEGGSGGLLTGAGGAAGGKSGFAGGSGSSAPNSLAGGGGGGWAFVGEAGEVTPEASAGWGGQGVYYDEGTDYYVAAILPIDEHWDDSFYPGAREALSYSFVIPSGQGPSFYDYMGIGGPGGVAVQGTGGEDPNLTCERAVGHYLDFDITVAEKGLGTCYEITNTYYATSPLTPVHPGMGGLGGTGTQNGTNGQVGLAYLRIYVPHVYGYDLVANPTTIGADDTVIFSYDAPDRSAIAFFVGETYVGGNPAWTTDSYTGSEVWDYYGEIIGGECREVVLQARLYSTAVVEAIFDEDTYGFTLNQVGLSALPDVNTAFLDSVDVTVSADSCASGGGGTGGSTTAAPVIIKVNPKKITVSNEIVTLFGSSLNGATHVVINGVRVEILTKSNNRITFRAPNGLSGSYDISVMFPGFTLIEKNGLVYGSVITNGARTVVPGFAQNSTVLTKKMKKEIRKFLKANPDYSSVTCKGFTSTPANAIDKKLARQRGQATCDYIAMKNPDLTVKVLKGSHTDAPGAVTRRVRITLR